MARCVTFLPPPTARPSFPSHPSSVYLRKSRDSFTNTTLGNTHPDDVDQRPAATPLAFHPLFYYLHFTAGSGLDPTAVLHTLLPTHPDCRRKLYAPLSGHASAACAFVTSPPVRSITLLHPDSESVIASVRNPDGCTVLDVNRLLGDMYVPRCFPVRSTLSRFADGRGHDRNRADCREASPICAPSCLITRPC